MANFDSIKNQIVNELNSERLSKVLPSIIVFAQNTGNTTFKQLCINELYGYDEGVELPKYRMIPVIFYDKDGNKITRYPNKSRKTKCDALIKRNVFFLSKTKCNKIKTHTAQKRSI